MKEHSTETKMVARKKAAVSEPAMPATPVTRPPAPVYGNHEGMVSFREKTFIAVAAAGALLIVCLLVLAATLQIRLTTANQKLSHTNQQLASMQDANDGSTQIAQLVDQVGKLMQLPTGEQPTIATVTDLSQLQNQPFFANAQVGDKVLIYQAAKEAILYRPSTNKIIEVAPVTDNATQDATTK